MNYILAIKFIALVASIFLGYTLGYIFTETKYDLAKYRFFQFKAFECRKCLSFHIAWVTSTIVSLLFNDWIMVAAGILAAFILFAGLLIDEKNRTVNIHENNHKLLISKKNEDDK